MPIISNIEARSLCGRLLHLAIILALVIGGFTMLYPMAIMVSGSLRSEMDEADLDLIPRFVVDNDALLRKFVETKYNQSVAMLNRAHQQNDFTFRDATVLKPTSSQPAQDLRRFLSEKPMPRHWQALGGIAGISAIPENLRHLRDRVRDASKGNLAAYGRASGTPISAWDEILFRPPDWANRQFGDVLSPLADHYFQMQDASDFAERQLVSVAGLFIETILAPKYDLSSSAAFNASHRMQIRSFEEFALPAHAPASSDPTLRNEWIEFVRTKLNPSFVLVQLEAAPEFRTHVQRKYESLSALNKSWVTELRSFDEVTLPDGRWLRGAERQDYADFLQTQPPENLTLIGPEYAWREWLTSRYRSIEELNEAHGSSYASFDTARLPVADMEYAYVQEHATSLRWMFATRNYVNVWRGLAGQGRALLNSLVLCASAILISLLINPLAAYALSQYRPQWTYKALLLLMATMSFPPMVTLIPTFILLRELHLLNTFAALLIPFTVNGYQIFLLKCFFDSIPREIYEAARIDGAGDARLFFQLTLVLSKPILAVVALGVFTDAYTMFVYALVVCPRQEMWVISVWLYQWQQEMSAAGAFAAVLVVSVPTLLTFLLAQRFIMKGIVVPVEK
jgi:multiple sugar transport system permease protein